MEGHSLGKWICNKKKSGGKVAKRYVDGGRRKRRGGGYLCSLIWGREWPKRWRETAGEWGRKSVKRWLGCSLRGRKWLATASQHASCRSKQPLDKCEILFLSHLSAALHYGCTQITTTLPPRSQRGRTWRWKSLSSRTPQQQTVQQWNECAAVKMLTAG